MELFPWFSEDKSGGWLTLSRVGLVACVFAEFFLGVHLYVVAFACGVYIVAWTSSHERLPVV